MDLMLDYTHVLLPVPACTHLYYTVTDWKLKWVK